MFVLIIYCWEWDLSLSMVCILSETPLKQLISPLSFLFRDDICVHFLPFNARTLPDWFLCRCCLCNSLSVSSYVCPVVSGRHYLYHSSFLALRFLLHFCVVTELWGERFGEDVLIKAEYYKVPHFLHTVQLWVSAFTLIYCRRNLFWWWLSDIQIYEYYAILLRVIL